VEWWICQLVQLKIQEDAMSDESLSKQQLLDQFAAAYERVIETATQAARRAAASSPAADTWGPREVVAHLAGWEVMANVRIPPIVAGMAPIEFGDRAQARIMNDAINATIVTIAGDQPLETLCGMLRQAYHRTLETLGTVDESNFEPGSYVYERTKAVIDHCQEHIDVHLSGEA
jgi:predicted metal-binding membrane protein